MAAWYYVSFNVAHSHGGGFGNIELELPSPPRPGGVEALADYIVQISRKRGTLPADAEVSVLAWSRMAD